MIRRALPGLLAILAATALVRCSSSTASGGGPGAQTTGADGASDAAGLDANPEASCSSDVASDPRNCGRCGHDCLGGACSEGLCQPVALAADRVGPGALAIDATHVYWLEPAADQLARVAKAGGVPDVLDKFVGNVSARHLCVDDARVYWADSSLIVLSVQQHRNSVPKAPTDGGVRLTYGVTLTLSTRGTLPLYVPGMALDGNDLLFTHLGGVARESKDGGPAPVQTFTSLYLTSLASDDAGAYFGSFGGVLSRSALDGGAATTLGSGLGDMEELLVNGDDLFWIAQDRGTIGIARNKSSPEIFAEGLDEPLGLAVDSSSVYWTEKDMIRSCPRSGCGAAPRVLAKGQARPTGIAVDDTSLYWSNTLGGTVVRMAK